MSKSMSIKSSALASNIYSLSKTYFSTIDKGRIVGLGGLWPNAKIEEKRYDKMLM